MATISKIIDPSGGGDFTTRQAAVVYMIATGKANYVFTEYSGGDLGEMDFTIGLGWTPDADNQITFQSAAGQEGNATDPTSRPYSVSGGPGDVIINLNLISFISITSGLVGSGEGNGDTGLYGPSDYCVLSLLCNLIDFPFFFNNDDVNQTGLVVRNSAAWLLSAISGSTAIYNGMSAGNPAESIILDYEVRNCTFYGFDYGIYDQPYAILTSAVVINSSHSNCICCGNQTADYVVDAAGGGGTETVNVTRTNSLSSDDTVGTGTGNLANKSATDVLADPSSGDLTLADNSPALLSAADLSTDFTTDALGVTRPAARWDMGAFQFSIALTGSIELFRLATPLSDGQTVQFPRGTLGAQLDERPQVELTVVNAGEGSLSISSIDVEGPFEIDSAGDLSAAGGEIDPSASQTLLLVMDCESAATQTGTLTIESDDPDVPAFTLDLLGRVDAPPPGKRTFGGAYWEHDL